MIADVAWDKFFAARALARQASLFADLAALSAPSQAPAPAPDAARALVQEPRLAALVTSLPAGDRLDAVQDAVVARITAILGIPREEIDFEQGFFDMGMDSLTAVQLRRQLDRVMDKPLAATVIFDFPTVANLAAHLLDQCGGSTPAHDAAMSPADRSMEAVKALSDADAEALINRALDRL